MKLLITLLVVVFSTLLYFYLHRKTHISLRYLYKDNVFNILVSAMLVLFVIPNYTNCIYLDLLSVFVVVPIILLLLAILRFYRSPFRKVMANDDEIVSPADGNVIYIKKVEKGKIPISIKDGVISSLNEFVNTEILDTPCWLVGINMTPFDVHKNCAPIDGKIILNKHFDGDFLSLKKIEALIKNERNTILISNPKGMIAVVQTASRLVRRIVTYKKVGETIKQGEWFGMIKFGSQVDVILPISCKINVELKQQVYAKKTIIAKW